jgi:phage terminase large subunit-like protein
VREILLMGRPRKYPSKDAKPVETRGEAVVRWIQDNCWVPEGGRLGQRIVLEQWQKEQLLRIYDNRVGTRRAILSFPRKNGKTTLAACILLVHLIGPEAARRPNSQIYSAAQSRDQAALIFALAAKMVRINPDMAESVSIHESTKSLVCTELGIRYRALSADATTAYGLSPALIIHDELGQICPRKQIKPLQNMGFQTAA